MLDPTPLPASSYPAYVGESTPAVFAVKPVCKPILPVIEYTLKDSDDGKVAIEMVVQIEYDIQREFNRTTGKYEYVFQSDPMVVSVSEVKQWLCGVEQVIHLSAKQAIEGANRWLNSPCVEAEVRDAILQHVRG